MGRTVWKFGEAPLPETERYAAIARRVSSLVLQMEGPSEVVAELIALLERAEAELGTRAPADPRPRVGEAREGDGRVYLDHSRNVGRYNPAFPLYALEVDGDRASGSVRFPVLYEGPPGLVHGGFLAAFFDMVIQHHNCDVGVAGKTTRLEVRYSAPTPLLEELRFEVERRAEGGRIESTARLFHSDVLCATATMRAVGGNLAALPPVSSRRRG
jgi:acyl-coenzyme A thioesterase PaaI-like protein